MYDLIFKTEDTESKYRYLWDKFGSNVLLLLNGEVVVYTFVTSYYGEYNICYIKSVAKEKGYGSKFIELLKEREDCYRIYGDSTVKAYPFWKKVGATFHRAEPCGHEDEIVYPFEILVGEKM